MGGGATAVHLCADRGAVEACRALVERGACGRKAALHVDDDGRTAAGCALAAGHEDCARSAGRVEWVLGGRRELRCLDARREAAMTPRRASRGSYDSSTRVGRQLRFLGHANTRS